VKTLAIATREVEQLIYEVHFGATMRVLHGPYTTGNLASQMYRRGPFVTANRVSGRVGNSASYARIVHDGAKIHEIYPKGVPHVPNFSRRGRPMLKFFWRRAGKVVYFAQVPGSPSTVGRSHPGQPGKHYLTKALVDVAERRGARVVIYDI
jgi:hypothetical protein